MSCWEILGISETEQEEEIRKAYLRLLPKFHPEENPEGFKALRQAMEEAVKYADSLKRQKEAQSREAKDVSMMDTREIRSLIKEAEELYRDFGKRILPDRWRELASRPVCQDLETQKEAGWALIGFLMDHIHIPGSCYRVLNETFGWEESDEELKAHFPHGFVDYLQDRIQGEDSFRYAKTPVRDDFDYEKYFETFFDIRAALEEKNREQVEEGLAKMEEMGLEHPDLTILKIRHYAMIPGMESRVWEMAKELYRIDGEYNSTRYWYVRSALETESAQAEDEELEEMIGTLVKENPDSPGYWQLCGSFLRSRHRLEQALVSFYRARDCGRGEWDYLEEQIAETAGELSRQMEEEGYEDREKFTRICWSARRYDKVRELLGQTEPEEDQKGDWLFMMAESCHHLEDYEEAAGYRKAIWEAYENRERPLELYLDLAGDLRLSGNTEEAMDIYTQAAEKFPEVPEVYYGQAQILEEKGQRRQAAEMCSKALEAGFHRDALNLRMELLLDLEEYEKVRAEAKEIMENGYRTAQILYDYAKALHNLESYEEAEEVLKELYERTEGSDMVCEEYASLCYDSDRSEEALRWIEEALGRRETLRRLYLKGSCLHDLNRYEEEAAVYGQVTAQNDDYYAEYRLGRALEGAGRIGEAESCFRTSLEKRLDYGSAWDGLGDVLQKQGKWQDAVTAYEAGKDLGFLQAARDLCRLLKRLHEDDRALSCIEECLKQWPEDGTLLLLRSDMLLRKKEYQEAIRCLNRYIEVRPSMTERGYREIAGCYERAKDLDKAREYYQKAIDLSPSSARCWRLMGKFLAEEAKDPKQALPYLEKSVELAPDSTYGFMKLGEVYESLGRKEDAVSCYEKALENYRTDIEKDPEDCCSYEGMADVLIHLGRLDEADETARKAISLEHSVFTCSCIYCYESYENLAKAEEKRGNLEKALEWMKHAGQFASTDYYPNEIARLKQALALGRETES